MENKYLISPSPHLHSGTSIKDDMWTVIKALLPALIIAIVMFGIDALVLTIYGILAAVITEAIILFLRKKPVTINDGSAVLTGMLVSFGVHAGVPWWIPVAGSIFAIAIGKHTFGGLGCNIVNPALLGRVFLVVSWPVYVTGNWVNTLLGSINGAINNDLSVHITGATPLMAIKLLKDPDFIETLGENSPEILERLYLMLTDVSTLMQLIIGNIGGCIGEISVAALILGGIYLLLKKLIDWRVPFFYILSASVMAFIFSGQDGFFSASISLVLFHLLSGALLLGAIFMATDPVTSPISKKGRIIFGIGCGVITMIIRTYSGLPEGVSFAILIMNLFVPLIDRFTYSKPFGRV